MAARELVSGQNQYPPMMGLPELRQAVAASARRFYGLDVDWKSEVLVTSGATEALSDCMAALIEPGDEVVLIEPLYDCYLPLVRRAGAIPKLVRVTPPDWRLDPDALAAAFGPKTKAILLNNPMNPAARVFTGDELALIADLVIRHDAYAICDEVYEHILFDGRRHMPLMTLPGMRERTIRIGSAGKTFSLTGWKVGYVTAAPRLLDPITKAHQFTTFTTPPNLQKAVAYGLGQGRRLLRQPVRRPAGQARPLRCRPRATRLRRRALRGHLFHHRRRRAARPRRRRRGALPHDRGGRRHRRSGLRLLPVGRAADFRPLLLLQARRGPRRRHRPAGALDRTASARPPESNPVLVEVTRGRPLVESRHRGAIAVVDAQGKRRAAIGDVERPVFPRSAVKALQALALVESGAADRYGFGNAELALACSSHNGEPRHVATAADDAGGGRAGRLTSNAAATRRWTRPPPMRWSAPASSPAASTTTAPASTPASSASPATAA